MGTILDLHIHSVFSIDSPVRPEEYVEYLSALRKNFRIDGLVFCEHRRFVSDFDHRSLSEKYGVLILAGAEADTRWGHLLVFCPDREWMSGFNFQQKLDPVELVKEVDAHQGVAVPAHPFRGMISMGERVKELPHLYAIEAINGGNRDDENIWAMELADRLGVAQVGGSDAHFLEELGAGLTEFQDQVRSMEELVAGIKSGKVQALSRDDARISDPTV